MLVMLDERADVRDVECALRGMGLWTERVNGPGGPPALVIGSGSAAVPAAAIAEVAGVARVLAPGSQHPKVDAQAGQTVRVAGTEMGVHAAPVLMAGPCGVESPEQIERAAEMAARAGARLLRGGAFKPR